MLSPILALSISSLARSIGEIVGRSVGSLGPASEFQLAAWTNEQLVARAIENTSLLIEYLKTLASESPTRSVTVTFGGPIIGYRVLNGGPRYIVFSQVSVVSDGNGGIQIMGAKHEGESLQTYALPDSKNANHPDAVLIAFKVIDDSESFRALVLKWRKNFSNFGASSARHVNGAPLRLTLQGGTVADARDFV